MRATIGNGNTQEVAIARAVNVMVAIGPNFFLQIRSRCLVRCGLIRASQSRPKRQGIVYRRPVGLSIDRAHRNLAPKQIEYLANIVRLYRGSSLN
jgi:type I restriction enzyme M protein